ncbi:MAG: hypothetical protein LBS85_06250 [Clostridiales Family XIII bacterium]|jgi:hypothetical protein|nr:hypothetical protein [Clostridiales Family XIII bacterium]
MKKKFIALIMMVALVVSLAACIGGAPSTSGNDNANSTGGSPAARLLASEIPNMLSDANKFKGRTVDHLPGVVFNAISLEAGDYEYQCWADDEHNQQFVIISETDLGLSTDISGGSNIFVNGTVRGANSGENYFGAEISSAIIEVTSIEKSETSVFNLASKTIDVNQTQEQSGISVTLEKVELANKSTRVFIRVANGTSDRISIYGFYSYIKQGSTQYDQSDISYEEDTIKTDLNSGIESAGCLSFETIDSSDETFTVSIDISSDDWDIELQPFVFEVLQQEEGKS